MHWIRFTSLHHSILTRVTPSVSIKPNRTGKKRSTTAIFESVGRHEVNVIKELGTQNNGSKFIHDESDKSGLTVGDKWPRAGEPYIVPQMTEYERNLKVKRFQQPKNGVNNGH